MIDECFFLYALDLSIYIHVLFDILCDSCMPTIFLIVLFMAQRLLLE
jgi:hypothetical protein